MKLALMKHAAEDDRSEMLELLSAAGVAMAGSFDLRHILRETHQAASRLLSHPRVDVLYLGRPSIHSRAIWYPEEPGKGNLTESQRAHLQDRLARISEREGGAEAVLARELTSGDRASLPVRYQEELLGVLFFLSSEGTSADSARLLSILAQHAATALRNIHLAQERIQFERLVAVGRMIGTVVHDLRGPLTAIRGYAGMLQSLDLADEERREYGRFMVEECDRLGHMVSELLEFTRGTSPDLAPQWIDLTEYLSTFAERLRRHYVDRKIEVDLCPGYRGEIRVDRPRLERALWNVAANACQSMPGGGALRIRSTERAGVVTIEVEDQGCGIPEDIRHRVFEPFFSYGKSEGIGLGMVTARKIVEEHGGEIEIESSTGVGTRVRFLLPVQGPAASLEEDRDPAAASN